MVKPLNRSFNAHFPVSVIEELWGHTDLNPSLMLGNGTLRSKNIKTIYKVVTMKYFVKSKDVVNFT